MKLAVPRVSFRSHCLFYRRCLSGSSNRHPLGVVHTNYLRLSISTSPLSSSCNNSTDPSAQILTRTKLNFTPPPRSYHQLSHPTADMGSQPEQNKQNGPVDLRPAEVATDLGYTPVIQVSGPWTVDKVVEKIPGDAPVEGSESPVPFFHLLERLKTTKREGWRRFGIERGESIADHMYRMSMISMFAPPSLAPKLDLAKCMKMCLIHDMAELLVGDITPVDGVPKPEKSRREAETMDFLTKNLLRNVAGGTTGEDIRAIWQEYEDSKTLESHFVHDVDKIELLLQMVEYEKHGDGKLDLGEFAYVATRITLPEMKTWAQEVLKEREAFWGSKAHVHGEQGVDGGVKPDRKGQQDDYYSRG